MSFFPFLNLPAELLVNVISKLEEKSYFNLQQTCREMSQLSQTNLNIKIHVKAYCRLSCQKDENGILQFLCNLHWLHSHKKVNTKGDWFYGARFADFCPSIEMDMDVFCDIMKKYRMNSGGLFMQFVDHRIDITKEQCLKLFNIFKPTAIKLNSRWSNRWEAILQVKEVKVVHAQLEAADALFAVKQFLPKFEQISLIVNLKRNGSDPHSIGQTYNLLSSILQCLRTAQPPSLHHHFSFYKVWYTPIISADDLLEQFQDFSPIVLKEERGRCELECRLGPNGSCCIVIFENGFVQILYRV